MEDVGLLPKASSDPAVHRPTVTDALGLHHVPAGGYELRTLKHSLALICFNKTHVRVCVCVLLFSTDRLHEASRKSDVDRDGPAKNRFQTVVNTEPWTITQFTDTDDTSECIQRVILIQMQKHSFPASLGTRQKLNAV